MKRLAILCAVLLLGCGETDKPKGKPANKAAKAVSGSNPAATQSAAEKAVRAYLMENANDASKLEIVKFGEPVPLEKCRVWAHSFDPPNVFKPLKPEDEHFWPRPKSQGVAILCKYRATNKAGALQINEHVFLVSDGMVIEMLKPNRLMVD